MGYNVTGVYLKCYIQALCNAVEGGVVSDFPEKERYEYLNFNF